MCAFPPALLDVACSSVHSIYKNSFELKRVIQLESGARPKPKKATLDAVPDKLQDVLCLYSILLSRVGMPLDDPTSSNFQR